MNLDSTITKRDVIATACFVVGAVLLYKSVKGLIESYQENKEDKKWREKQRKKLEAE